MTWPRVLAMAVLAAASAVEAAERPVRGALCPETLPEGVHLPPQPGCAPSPQSPKPRRDGFRDLGEGVSVRIGGRVGAESGMRR